jgi:hypothetical protein
VYAALCVFSCEIQVVRVQCSLFSARPLGVGSCRSCTWALFARLNAAAEVSLENDLHWLARSSLLPSHQKKNVDFPVLRVFLAM